MHNESLDGIPGLGEKRLAELRKSGVITPEDLIKKLPVSYRDYTAPRPIGQLRPGMKAIFKAALKRLPSIKRVGALSVLSAVFHDESGKIQAVFFNQPYLRSTLKIGAYYHVYAEIVLFGGSLRAQSPIIVPEGEVGAITPLYPPMKTLPAKTYRNAVRAALEVFRPDDMLPETILRRNALMPLDEAYSQAHFPQSKESLSDARRRLAFDELLYYQIALGFGRGRDKGKGIAMRIDRRDIDDVVARMPFELTRAQKRSIGEIITDLEGDDPMARLLQGDVGSGKTAVAQAALYACVKAGYQGALMAPTEVLARQHFKSFQELLEPLGVNVGLLIGALTRKEHRLAHEAVRTGEWDIVIGTHALVTDKVEYKNLGLVITDEQHRFGVNQRQALSMKAEGANVLVMSATPIPRSLSLILYGDLDISLLDELPPGRLPVRTHIVRESKREGMYGFLREQVAAGRQGYVVCPLIEESEAMDLMSAQQTYEMMMEKLPDVKVALVHGSMKTAEKQGALEGFYAGETDILVSTTVIEVGVNVPNASFMVIEDAHRFGLAQLHQLRGRVGRGGGEAFCFLMASGGEKLRILTDSNDGFVIAQKDLELRGPGEVLGTRQSGLLDAGIASGMSDVNLLEKTHKEARAVLESPEKHAALIDAVVAIYATRISEMAVN
ncbi:MAG: ATP-dependent DNA helicase RecG [Christensenellales bacterium]|jgi:ATP-dependent DNA helicase RecG